MKRRNTVLDPFIPIYFTKNDKKFNQLDIFKVNSDSDADWIIDKAKFLLRNDKEKPKNEQNLTLYIQLVHENIMNNYVFDQFEKEKEMLQDKIKELTLALEEQTEAFKKMQE